MEKEDVIHIYNGIILSHKNEWNNAIFSNMNATRNYHTKWSKSERKTIYDLTYMWYLKYDTNDARRLKERKEDLIASYKFWGCNVQHEDYR